MIQRLGKKITIFCISIASPFNISGAKLIYYTSPLFNPRLLLPSPPPQGLFATTLPPSKATAIESLSLSLPLDLVVFLSHFVKPMPQISSLASNMLSPRVQTPSSPAHATTRSGCQSMQRHSFFLRLVVRETNATVLFVGLRYVKPKKPASIFALMRFHVRPKIWPPIYAPSKVVVNYCSDSNESMLSSCTFYLKKGLLLHLFLKPKLLIF